MIEHLVEYAEGAAVDVARNQNLIARFKQAEYRRDRRHARAESKACLAALKLRDQRFQCGAGRISRARILPLWLLTQAGLLIGRGLIDRNIDRSGEFILFQIVFIPIIQNREHVSRRLLRGVQIMLGVVSALRAFASGDFALKVRDIL